MSKEHSDLLEKQTSTIIHYQSLFKTHDGLDVLNDLMKKNHIFNGTFDKDPMVMAFREGQRSVIVEIIHTLGIDISEFKKMYEQNMGD